MSISNFNCYYKDYKKYLKNINKKNVNYKPLVAGLLKKTGGRNNKGFITSYHRGGGVKRLFKKICFSYVAMLNVGLKDWIVERVEYDCNRSSNIALLKYNALKLNLKKKKWKKKKMIF